MQPPWEVQADQQVPQNGAQPHPVQQEAALEDHPQEPLAQGEVDEESQDENLLDADWSSFKLHVIPEITNSN